MAATEVNSTAFAPRSARLRLEKIFFPSMALLIIAAVILVIALLRADRHVLFTPGWWRW